MTIANNNKRVQYTAAGGQTTFAYNFKIEAEDEIAVYLTPDGNDPDDTADLLTLTTHYTLTGVGDDAGGNIVLVSGAATDDVLTAVRAIDIDQPDSYSVGQDNAANYEASLDRMVMRLQRLEEIVARSLKMQVTDGTELVLPVASDGKVLEWSSGQLVNANKMSGSGVASAAVDVSIDDAGGYYASVDVEAALQESVTRIDGLRMKVFEIGGWDMDASSLHYVSHAGSLDPDKVRGINAIIRPDNTVYHRDFMSINGSESSSHSVHVNDTNIVLNRGTGGIFDGTLYDDTGINRGYVTVFYVD